MLVINFQDDNILVSELYIFIQCERLYYENYKQSSDMYVVLCAMVGL